jgi:hypothetical protein
MDWPTAITIVGCAATLFVGLPWGMSRVYRAEADKVRAEKRSMFEQKADK